MRAESSFEAEISRAIEGTPMPDGARSCTSNFGKVVRAFWPHKTAEHLAARASCGIRTAKYVLAGHREPTRTMIAVVLSELLAD